jgi:hypothetical protein
MVIIASVFVFIIAVIFRLLDNSAKLFISNGVSVSPFYLSAETVIEEMNKLDDDKLKQKLRRNLFFQKLHKVFTILAIITLITGIILEINHPELIYLF